MIQRLKFTLLTLLAGSSVWLSPAAKADEWDKLTVLTFNEPVEIPGKVLPAGTCVFKLADSQSDRNVVQVFTQDQKQILATILAIPNSRPEPASKTIVTFEERPSGSPEALHSWFYPGETTGVEFVYKKSERQYAARSEEPLMTPPAPDLPVVQQTAAKQADPEPSVPVVEGEEEEDAVSALATPVAPVESPDTLPNTLPHTNGNFAGIPLLGVLLLSGGFTAIRFATRQS